MVTGTETWRLTRAMIFKRTSTLRSSRTFGDVAAGFLGFLGDRRFVRLAFLTQGRLAR